jgi:two-component system CheB/CheR fusion protein
MAVLTATDGSEIAADHVYICPPGHFLGLRFGILKLSHSVPGRGARLPIDFLIRSLSATDAARSTCVILSGAGTDGSGGLAEFKRHGGTILVQDPEEAEYDGMPRSAILTGLVDAVLPIAEMPAALASGHRAALAAKSSADAARVADADVDVPAFVAVLKAQTGQDFSQYKPGTLTRRIERRLGLSGFAHGDFAGYLRKLQDDKEECRVLGEDLLINVTSFFRDPAVFDVLEHQILPELIQNLPADQALRVWVAGCSMGEEAYTIAMICRDVIMAARRDIKLQVFASDIDADAIAVAREGAYPLSITGEIPADRLARYFLLEDDTYRVTPGLRGSVIFTVQDVLNDPPFSRIDLVSCRNLLIYLKPEAQAKVISLFHFALRENGILLLGSAETPGTGEDRFKPLHKAERIYRHIAQSRPGEPGFPLSFVEAIPRLTAQERRHQLNRQSILAELSRDLVIDSYAPASVLINDQRQCLFSLGPVSRFLRVAPGLPTLDLLALAPEELRATLRFAIGQSNDEQPVFRTRPCQTIFEGQTIDFTVHIRFLTSEGENLHLVSFVEDVSARRDGLTTIDQDTEAQIRSLERELELSHAELLKAIQSRDALVLEQKAINDEALSVNEEFQSTNEELLTSKEELQSLNEELIALNSTNVATLFLDQDLRIRFFTPATRAFFNVIPGDIGRPLSDLHSLAGDEDLLVDAGQVLVDRESIEREIGGANGQWFLRRIFPYRTHDGQIEGVVITFIDITERRKTAEALELAKREAERSNRGKSRFLAVASHDLRQPLQALKLIQQLLQQSVADEQGRELVTRVGQLLAAMSGMLDALLDINQIEAGVLQADARNFPLGEIFDELRTEFLTLANAHGLELGIVPSSATVHSDPRLLEVMLRNLLANAVKYTDKGRILVGCRHQGQAIRIEVWDTGIGIPHDQLARIFDEFHQVDSGIPDREHGFGLGLAIVKHLGLLLGHKVEVRSWPGRGSVFSVTIPAGPAGDLLPTPTDPAPADNVPPAAEQPDKASRAIVVIEDDPDILELLRRVLTDAGHSITAAVDGPQALKLVAEGAIRPEIVLTDYNLPGGMDGLATLTAIRAQLDEHVPGIVLTGDISGAALARIALADCVLLDKPVSSADLLAPIGTLSPPEAPRPRSEKSGKQAAEIICVVDDSPDIQTAIRAVLEDDGRTVKVYPSAEAFLAAHVAGQDQCLIIDTSLPGMSGIDLIEHLREQGDSLPAILITGQGDVGMAVRAMRAGASDFIEKPVARITLIELIDRAVMAGAGGTALEGEAAAETRRRLDRLTERQKTVLDLVLAGNPSKNIAADLGVSQRTVENHRAEIMHKLGVRSIPDLVRMVLSASTP